MPTLEFLFDAKLHVGVRSSALPSHQSSEQSQAIRAAAASSVTQYANGSGHAISATAHIIAASAQ